MPLFRADVPPHPPPVVATASERKVASSQPRPADPITITIVEDDAGYEQTCRRNPAKARVGWRIGAVMTGPDAVYDTGIPHPRGFALTVS
jgi:hypothetical protein